MHCLVIHFCLSRFAPPNFLMSLLKWQIPQSTSLRQAVHSPHLCLCFLARGRFGKVTFAPVPFLGNSSSLALFRGMRVSTRLTCTSSCKSTSPVSGLLLTGASPRLNSLATLVDSVCDARMLLVSLLKLAAL